LWDVLEQHPEGMSPEQVGAVLGCDRSTVEKIERHALARLSVLLRAFR
jgi:DNA-directed RNA polymerase specialized sigma24 family protein